MSFEIRHEKDISVIYLNGRFVFDSHKSFRETYDQALARSDTHVIQLDMDKVEYLDSSPGYAADVERQGRNLRQDDSDQKPERDGASGYGNRQLP